MAKKKTRSLKKWKKRMAEKRALRIKPVPPVEPEDITYAARVYDLAHQPDSPLKTPVTRSVTLDMGDDETQEFTLTDNPLNRFFSALAGYCGDDEEKYAALSSRFFAFAAIARSEKMKAYVIYSDDGGQLLHTAIFDAAAVAPLMKERGREELFDEDEFFAKLRELAAESETGQSGTSSS